MRMRASCSSMFCVGPIESGLANGGRRGGRRRMSCVARSGDFICRRRRDRVVHRRRRSDRARGHRRGGGRRAGARKDGSIRDFVDGNLHVLAPHHHENGIRTLRRHGRRLRRRLLCRVLSRARDDERAKVGGVRFLHLEVFLIVLLKIFLDVVMQRRAVHGADAAGLRGRRALWLREVFPLLIGEAPDRVEAVESRLVHPCRGAIVLLLHFADRHLAFAFHRRIGVDRRELVRDVTDQKGDPACSRSG